MWAASTANASRWEARACTKASSNKVRAVARCPAELNVRPRSSAYRTCTACVMVERGCSSSSRRCASSKRRRSDRVRAICVCSSSCCSSDAPASASRKRCSLAAGSAKSHNASMSTTRPSARKVPHIMHSASTTRLRRLGVRKRIIVTSCGATILPCHRLRAAGSRTSTWTRSTRPWSCCATPNCRASRWSSAADGATSLCCRPTARGALHGCATTPAAAWPPPPPMRRATWACTPAWG